MHWMEATRPAQAAYRIGPKGQLFLRSRDGAYSWWKGVISEIEPSRLEGFLDWQPFLGTETLKKLEAEAKAGAR